MTKIINFLKDESGASAAEYAIILAVIGVALVAAMGALGTAIGTAVNNTVAIINP